MGQPPRDNLLQSEDEQHCHECHAGVQSCAKDVVVPLPPPLLVIEEVEEGDGDKPDPDVGGRHRRHASELVGNDIHEGDSLLSEDATRHPRRHQ